MSDIAPTTTRDLSLMGVALSLRVPNTGDEFDRLTGQPGSCAAEAVANLVYRGYASGFRTRLKKVLKEKHSLEPQVLEKDENGKPKKVESDDDFVSRITEDETVKQQVADAGAEVAAEWTFEKYLGTYGQSVRGSVGKDLLEAADTVMRAWETGKSSPSIFLDKIRTFVPNASLSENPSQEEVALLIRAKNKAAQTQSLI